MDPIPFVKVTIDEAKAALQRDARKTSVAPTQARDWAVRRTSSNHVLPDLSAATFKWIASMPLKLRPYQLARQFPRIANRLAETWSRPEICERYLDELIMDSRGGRKGFPPEVATEIAALKAHFMRVAATVQYGVWSNRLPHR